MQKNHIQSLVLALILLTLMPELRSELAPCPSSPNCVSSLAQSKSQKVEPLLFKGDPTQALASLERCILGMAGVKVEAKSDLFWHTTFTTRWLRFIDDVHFLVQPDQGQIQIRSASRVGYGDFGTNRRRVNRIIEICQPKLLSQESVISPQAP
ncbi:MAG TPA: DUF1499 domain-containing protein [Gammaproteobacteria bacterium]|nr:DUF1499 domain-containing protein [Gammaproteobacteria bacterium]